MDRSFDTGAKTDKAIGIFGGTFNPVHYGHLMIADNAFQQFKLEKVIFLPTGKSPHKAYAGADMTPHRVNMLELAIKDDPVFDISYYEVERTETSYTYQTLDHFIEMYPGYKLYFILGADSLFDFETWREPGEIFKKCEILAAVRAEVNEEKLDSQIRYLNEKYNARIHRIVTPNYSVSSKYIRGRILEGKTIKYMLPPAVAGYIRDNFIYMEDTPTKYNEIKDILEKELKGSRFNHTLGVVETARKLATRYSVDVNRASLAALLHDCAKYMPNDDRVDYCRKYGVEITEAEMKNKFLLHAKCGAILAREKYGIEDEDILHAITVHTTGCPDMNILDKIIYIADYIEPNRNQAPNLDIYRTLAFYDLDKTIMCISKDTINHLKTVEGSVLDKLTEKTYEYYRDIVNSRDQ